MGSRADGRLHLAEATSNMQLISGYRTLPSAADDNRLDGRVACAAARGVIAHGRDDGEREQRGGSCGRRNMS